MKPNTIAFTVGVVGFIALTAALGHCDGPWSVRSDIDKTCRPRNMCNEHGCLSVHLEPDCGPRTIVSLTLNGKSVEECDDDQSCLDKAFALNDAHRRRMLEAEEPVFRDIPLKPDLKNKERKGIKGCSVYSSDGCADK